MHHIREDNRKLVESLGYNFNPNLPLTESVEVSKSSQEIENRLLTLHAIVAFSYGCPKTKVKAWLEHNELIEELTSLEYEHLFGSSSLPEARFKWQVEALWTLAWSVSLVDELDFSTECSDNLIDLLPDILKIEPLDWFNRKINLRDANEILSKLDLAYCIHWAVNHRKLSNIPNIPNKPMVQDGVIVERRWALEWIIGKDEWDDVQLDT